MSVYIVNLTGILVLPEVFSILCFCSPVVFCPCHSLCTYSQS